jgi:hypothetical protein
MLYLKAVQVKQFNKHNKIIELFDIQTKNYGGSNSRSEIHPNVYCIMHSTKQKKLRGLKLRYPEEGE